jgi:hypothetical protein
MFDLDPKCRVSQEIVVHDLLWAGEAWQDKVRVFLVSMTNIFLASMDCVFLRPGWRASS